jgi:hypothetical protein
MCPCVVLTLVIREIFLSLVPGYSINVLCFFIPYPKESHFHRSQPMSFYGVIGNPDRRGIITMYGGSWLCVAQVLQRLSENNSILAIVEEGAEFGFSRGCHNKSKIVVFT